MKKWIFFFAFFLIIKYGYADLKYQPIRFLLSTEKESYYEGEKITFNITITNTDKQNTYPVLVPHTQNTGQKLFYLSVYDRANNTRLMRYTENRMLHMMVHDTGSVRIIYLKPLEQIVVPIYLNDFENYYSYHTQNASHHSFEVPLFAGVYKVNVTYNPYGIALADSIYSFYDGSKTSPEESDFMSHRHTALEMPSTGCTSNMLELRIRRSADTVVVIERKKYYVKTDGDRYFYLSENLPKITTDTRCHHITNLPPDSCSLKNEYFYSHFTDVYAEYVNRFKDGDIREYRKFSDYCPDYLYSEKYDESKRKTLYALQLADKRFYSISYAQPGNKIVQESYCSEDGTLCDVTQYMYDKEGEYLKKEKIQTQPCVVVDIGGKKRSTKRGVNLEGKKN